MGCGSSQEAEYPRRVSLWQDDPDHPLESDKAIHHNNNTPNSHPHSYGQSQGHVDKFNPKQPANHPMNEGTLPVNRENVLAYLEVDQNVRKAESRNIKMRLLTKQKERSDLEQTVLELTTHYNKCLSKTAKEKADVDQLNQSTVLEFFKDRSQYDAAMSKEQEEYLESLSEQEVAQKELKGVKSQLDSVKKEIAELTQDCKMLEDLHNKQDEMLKGFFNGTYGSDKENILESELDLCLDRQQRVMVSKDKWQNGRLLLYHACEQMSTGNIKWSEVIAIPPGNLQRRYYLATEARNHFIAASQNISNTGRLLYSIRFPYCTPDEVYTLNRAVAHIYTDMQSSDRHQHAAQCYYVTHKRAAALLQWFDQVIDKRILVDLDRARQDTKMKSRELRNERIRLLKQKYLENTGDVINIPEYDRDDDIIDEAPKTAVSKVDAVTGAEQLPKGNEPELLSAQTQTKVRIPTPIPVHELAPPPTEEEMFGNLQELQKKHQREVEEYERVQRANRARQEQGLQQKLQERRSRLAREKSSDISQ